MAYQFEKIKRDFSDLASGNVIYNKPGATAFPVRAASEAIQFCLHYLRKERCTIYDPCCGSAYHLTALGFLHFDRIDRIICSDIDQDVLVYAQKNLGLLTAKGIDARAREIEAMLRSFQKESHREASESAARLGHFLQGHLRTHNILSECFRANVLEPYSLARLASEQIDIVFADVPYGSKTQWSGCPDDADAISKLLDNLLTLKISNGLVVIASTKRQLIGHTGYALVKKIKIGTRVISILRPAQIRC